MVFSVSPSSTFYKQKAEREKRLAGRWQEDLQAVIVPPSGPLLVQAFNAARTVPVCSAHSPSMNSMNNARKRWFFRNMMILPLLAGIMHRSDGLSVRVVRASVTLLFYIHLVIRVFQEPIENL
jgi:hypothetical protein